MLNFGKPKPQFGSVLKAKSSVWLGFESKKLGLAHLCRKNLCSDWLPLSKSMAQLGSPKSRLRLITLVFTK